jgi:hypothetical protein
MLYTICISFNEAVGSSDARQGWIKYYSHEGCGKKSHDVIECLGIRQKVLGIEENITFFLLRSCDRASEQISL